MTKTIKANSNDVLFHSFRQEHSNLTAKEIALLETRTDLKEDQEDKSHVSATESESASTVQSCASRSHGSHSEDHTYTGSWKKGLEVLQRRQQAKGNTINSIAGSTMVSSRASSIGHQSCDDSHHTYDATKRSAKEEESVRTKSSQGELSSNSKNGANFFDDLIQNLSHPSVILGISTSNSNPSETGDEEDEPALECTNHGARLAPSRSGGSFEYVDFGDVRTKSQLAGGVQFGRRSSFLPLAQKSSEDNRTSADMDEDLPPKKLQKCEDPMEADGEAKTQDCSDHIVSCESIGSTGTASRNKKRAKRTDKAVRSLSTNRFKKKLAKTIQIPFGAKTKQPSPPETEASSDSKPKEVKTFSKKLPGGLAAKNIAKKVHESVQRISSTGKESESNGPVKRHYFSKRQMGSFAKKSLTSWNQHLSKSKERCKMGASAVMASLHKNHLDKYEGMEEDFLFNYAAEETDKKSSPIGPPGTPSWQERVSVLSFETEQNLDKKETQEEGAAPPLMLFASNGDIETTLPVGKEMESEPTKPSVPRDTNCGSPTLEMILDYSESGEEQLEESEHGSRANDQGTGQSEADMQPSTTTKSLPSCEDNAIEGEKTPETSVADQSSSDNELLDSKEAQRDASPPSTLQTTKPSSKDLDSHLSIQKDDDLNCDSGSYYFLQQGSTQCKNDEASKQYESRDREEKLSLEVHSNTETPVAAFIKSNPTHESIRSRKAECVDLPQQPEGTEEKIQSRTPGPEKKTSTGRKAAAVAMAESRHEGSDVTLNPRVTGESCSFSKVDEGQEVEDFLPSGVSKWGVEMEVKPQPSSTDNGSSTAAQLDVPPEELRDTELLESHRTASRSFTDSSRRKGSGGVASSVLDTNDVNVEMIARLVEGTKLEETERTDSMTPPEPQSDPQPEQIDDTVQIHAANLGKESQKDPEKKSKHMIHFPKMKFLKLAKGQHAAKKNKKKEPAEYPEEPQEEVQFQAQEIDEATSQAEMTNKQNEPDMRSDTFLSTFAPTFASSYVGNRSTFLSASCVNASLVEEDEETVQNDGEEIHLRDISKLVTDIFSGQTCADGAAACADDFDDDLLLANSESLLGNSTYPTEADARKHKKKRSHVPFIDDSTKDSDATTDDDDDDTVASYSGMFKQLFNCNGFCHDDLPLVEATVSSVSADSADESSAPGTMESISGAEIVVENDHNVTAINNTYNEDHADKSMPGELVGFPEQSADTETCDAILPPKNNKKTKLQYFSVKSRLMKLVKRKKKQESEKFEGDFDPKQDEVGRNADHVPDSDAAAKDTIAQRLENTISVLSDDVSSYDSKNSWTQGSDVQGSDVFSGVASGADLESFDETKTK